MTDTIKGQRYQHYFKDVSSLDNIDVYAVLSLWGVECHATGHAVKKLLNAGQRGHKDTLKDLTEAQHSIDRAIELLELKK